MCVGALMASDADSVVFALPDPDGACGSALQLADPEAGRRRLGVVSGILRDEAAELHEDRRTARSRVPG
jgi:tRNA(Arg) A34 adenosine deaminase TadA